MNTIKLVTTKTRNYWTDYAEPEEVLEYFKDHQYIGFDTETSGFSFMTSELLSIQFGDLDTQYVVDLDGIDIQIFKPLLEKKTLVLQNAAFDLPFLYAHGIVPLVYDTLLAEKNLTLGILVKRSLDELALRYCGVTLDKGMQAYISGGLISEEAITYAGLDVKYLLPIMEAQLERARKEQVQNAIQLDCRFVRVVAYMEYCGIYVDTDVLNKLVRRNEAYEYMAEEALFSILKENYEELYDPDFNWGSSKQVISLFKNFGIHCINPKTGADTVDASALRKIRNPPQLLEPYLDYSAKRKLVTTYGRNWFDYVQADGRVHSKFNVLVDTGRTSAGDTRNGPFPNLQNCPRPSKKDPLTIRSIFKAKGPNVIIACDYSGQESVVLADVSQEPKLLDFYRRGSGDLHSYVAKLLFPDEIGDTPEDEVANKFSELRQIAKSANFAIAYGGTGYTISQNLNLPKEVGERVYNAYTEAFPGLAEFFVTNFMETASRGYIRINTVTGRKRKIHDINNALKNPKLVGHINRLSTNTKIQGTSADISKTAAVLFFEWILENKFFGKILIINFVHDELVVECHQSRAEKVAAIVQEKMELAGTYFLNTLPLKAEPKIAKQWSK